MPKCGLFIEITIRLGRSAVNLLHISRTPFTKNTSGWVAGSVSTFCINGKQTFINGTRSLSINPPDCTISNS